MHMRPCSLTQRHILENRNIHLHRCGSFKIRVTVSFAQELSRLYKFLVTSPVIRPGQYLQSGK